MGIGIQSYGGCILDNETGIILVANNILTSGTLLSLKSENAMVKVTLLENCYITAYSQNGNFQLYLNKYLQAGTEITTVDNKYLYVMAVK